MQALAAILALNHRIIKLWSAWHDVRRRVVMHVSFASGCAFILPSLQFRANMMLISLDDFQVLTYEADHHTNQLGHSGGFLVNQKTVSTESQLLGNLN